MNIEKLQVIVDEISSLYRINGAIRALDIFRIKVSIVKLKNRVVGLYIYNRATQEFKIQIDSSFNEMNSDDVVFGTLWHEMCHFLCQITLRRVGHTSDFQRFYELLELKSIDIKLDYKYNFHCLSCGCVSGFFRHHKKKKHMCVKCGSTKFKVERLR